MNLYRARDTEREMKCESESEKLLTCATAAIGFLQLFQTDKCERNCHCRRESLSRVFFTPSFQTERSHSKSNQNCFIYVRILIFALHPHSSKTFPNVDA